MVICLAPTLAARNRRSPSWSDLFGMGLMGGSSPSYGAGWDQLFGNALLTIAGYGGNNAHSGDGGYNYANGFAHAGGHGGGLGVPGGGLGGGFGGGFPSFGGGFDQGHHGHSGHHGHHDHVLGTHTVVTKKVGYPVPQPYPVPVERRIPYPVSCFGLQQNKCLSYIHIKTRYRFTFQYL